MEKCKYADVYKAKYPPRCGCRTCNDKWNRSQEEVIREADHLRRRQEDEDLNNAILVASTIIACM